MPIYAKSDNESGHDQQGYYPEGANSKGDPVVDYEYVKCGYGKLIWPDGSTLEGYWINGQACGVGVFRAPEPSTEYFHGIWQNDR